MINISVRFDVKALQRDLNNLARKQVPFATAQALNVVAKQVQAAERTNMAKVLDKPTPFTLNSIGVKLATKSSLTARVFVKDIAAAYLLPYEKGGKNKLNGRALLKPVGQKVNQYGNLPRNKIRQLLAKPNVFVGVVTFKKSGRTINGVWERPMAGQRERTGKYGTKGDTQNRIGGVRTGLKLLVKFEDAHEAKQWLNYQGVARKVIAASFSRELSTAMGRAIASAKK
ncbi:MAG: hypothetical protein ACN6OP_16015 [Pseudomonadales bacterium]